MSKLLAIDPGNEQSGYVLYDTASRQIVDKGKVDNHKLLELIIVGDLYYDAAAIEMIACYGMAVGRSVFDTCVWIGRFTQALAPQPVQQVFRREVKMALCNTVKAKDANVRQALIDRFPASGGGVVPQIGTKSKPGPLYGVKADIWAALGIAVALTG